MMKKTLIIGLLLSLNLVFSLNALAAKAAEVSPKEAITMEKAKQIALSKVKGKILSAKVEKDDGMEKYEIIVQAKDGKYEIEIEKSSGKVLEVEKEGAGHGHGTDDDHHEGEDDRYDD
ncbi:PepSY domain-containing protein [Neobacillus sp. PS3-12]|jgi:antitoxin component YwqK of YwqJK toxin-antitoxin module|uniref:PepSY domain-containing protein n=1 Tax=Neobacillus sp. PS3-12 TaxID=3070677 RepID=UPI0027E06C2B|nr:PepSY domain-containing protein [Neobacillus sp. PS3-12]WML50833.1 PepSY domain-containing protein [Neobacillus sp. PS3-12]